MIIKMPFVLICVSVALFYLSIVIRKGTQVISKQISNNCFLFTRVACIFDQKCNITHQMLLIYPAMFLDNCLFECFIKAQQISLLKLM